METVFVPIKDEKDIKNIKLAADILKRGGLVALPTETVYGLGANALDETAVAHIFAAKGRPQDNPLIIHVSCIDDVSLYTEDVPSKAYKLMEALCPGPLTVILKRKSNIPDIVSANLETVAVRIPKHAITRAIIKEAGVPIAAPSANLSGKPSPTTAAHVAADMDGKIDMIIDGGPCAVGLESTVVDLTGDIPMLLRPGQIGLSVLRKFLPNIEVDKHVTDLTVSDGPVRSPGMKYKHYSPNAEVIVIEGTLENTQKEILSQMNTFQNAGKKVGVLAQDSAFSPKEADTILYAGDTLDHYAAHLFSYLRQFDDLKMDVILAQFEPKGDISLAIKNRLYRSAANHIIRV